MIIESPRALLIARTTVFSNGPKKYRSIYAEGFALQCFSLIIVIYNEILDATIVISFISRINYCNRIKK